MSAAKLLVDGLGFPESTRWHDGRVWLCNWGAGEVLAVASGGEREVMARVAPDSLPFSIDWLPDGRLLVIDGPRRSCWRRSRMPRSNCRGFVRPQLGAVQRAGRERGG